MKRIVFSALLALTFGAGPSLAASPLGTWLSPPDHKGQVGHIQLRRCGSAICGTLVRSYDRQGNQIKHPNVGRRLVWDMRPKSDGAYAGQVFVPLMGRAFSAEMRVGRNALKVRGCSPAGLCKSQTWRRVN